MPPYDGRELTWSNTPDERSNFIVTPLSMVRATVGERPRGPAARRLSDAPFSCKDSREESGGNSREKPFERAVLLCFGCFGHDSRARSCTRRDRSTTHHNFQRLAVAGRRQGPPDRRANLIGILRYPRLVPGHGSGHGADDAGQQPRLPRAALRRKQPPRESFPKASSIRRTGIAPSSLFPTHTRIATSGSTSTASTTRPKCG